MIQNSVFDNDGYFDKVVGDSVLAVYGYPIRNSLRENVLNAVKSTIEIMEKCKTIVPQVTRLGENHNVRCLLYE